MIEKIYSTSDIKPSERNVSFHILRLTLVLGIIGAHTYLSNQFSNLIIFAILEAFIRICVPVFFCLAGFFLYKNIPTRGKGYIWSYIRRLIIIILLWGILFFCIFMLPSLLANDFSFSKKILIITRSFILYGGYYHLWFIPSLAFAAIALWLFIRLKWINTQMLIVCGILYLVGVFFNNYYLLFPLDSYLETIRYFLNLLLGDPGRNWLFEGVPLVFFGAYLHKYLSPFQLLKKNTKILLLIGSVMILIIEILIMYHYVGNLSQDLYIFLPIVAVFIIAYLNEDPTKKYIPYLPKNIVIYDLSLGIYLIHPFFIEILKPYEINSIIVYVITCVLSFIVVLMYKILRNKKSLTIHANDF